MEPETTASCDDSREEKIIKFIGSYDDAVMYSTNPSEKKLWYICPRYWDIKNQKPIKELSNEDRKRLIHPDADETDLTKIYF